MKLFLLTPLCVLFIRANAGPATTTTAMPTDTPTLAPTNVPTAAPVAATTTTPMATTTTMATTTAAPNTTAAPQCTGSATYTIKFTGKWTSSMLGYPSNAHWSPFVVASHSSAYTMWKAGAVASDAVEEVAETGQTTKIKAELTAKQTSGEVKSYVIGSGIAGSGQGVVTVSNIQVDATHPYISAITMIAPSPDWFAGASSLSLCQTTTSGTASWVQSFKTSNLQVIPWDAGTEEGTTFSINNAATNPRQPISKVPCGVVFCASGGTLPSVGQIEVTNNAKPPGSGAPHVRAVFGVVLSAIISVFLLA